MRATLVLAAAAVLVAATAPLPADAACKRMGFLVNDYGKDGPTKDAKSLLDKHIAEWAAKAGVKDYSVGPKSVSCELFLNFVVFDEHTCTASANVCWGPDKKQTDQQAAAPGTPPTPVRKSAATETGKKGHKSKVAKTEAPAGAAPAEEAAAPADAAAVAPDAGNAPAPADAAPQNALGDGLPSPSDADPAAAAPSSVETGALGSATAPAAAPAVPAASATKKGKASEAASAAAAAAERAAAAAETAANAAKEAAAAAVAASAAGRGSFVPPLGEAADAGTKSQHRVGDAAQ